ncbi:MAG: hypothetical protein ABI460_16550 [Caldimonas sp.]
MSKAAEEVQARQAEFEAAQEAYAKGAFELRCIEFDQANLAAADAFFELQAAVPPSLRNIWRLPFVDSLCLLVGASKAHREMVGAETVEPFDGRKLQYQLALRGPGESLTPAAEALLSVDWKQLPMNMPVVEESETVRENIRLRKEQETIASAPVDHQDRIEWMRKRAGTAPAAAARTMA